jgi:hypothetical protein
VVRRGTGEARRQDADHHIDRTAKDHDHNVALNDDHHHTNDDHDLSEWRRRNWVLTPWRIQIRRQFIWATNFSGDFARRHDFSPPHALF